jgi:deoxyadenosine/deoxycytidine kinase
MLKRRRTQRQQGLKIQKITKFEFKHFLSSHRLTTAAPDPPGDATAAATAVAAAEHRAQSMKSSADATVAIAVAGATVAACAGWTLRGVVRPAGEYRPSVVPGTQLGPKKLKGAGSWPNGDDSYESDEPSAWSRGDVHHTPERVRPSPPPIPQQALDSSDRPLMSPTRHNLGYSSPPSSPLDDPEGSVRRPTTAEPLVCVIDGAIGAGKTTLIELVRDRLESLGHNTVVVKEPVEEWKRVGILQEFYDHGSSPEPGMVAYDFQTYTFVTRVEETIKTAEAHPEATIFLLERSPWTDRFVFMELQRDLCGPRRMEMYERWWNLWMRIMPFAPNKIVYLKPSLQDCMGRVNLRAREGEVKNGQDEETAQAEAEEEDDTGGDGVLAAYQARLIRAHDCFLLGEHAAEFPMMPARPFKPGQDSEDVITVDGALADDDFSVPGEAQERILTHIVQRLVGTPA